VNGEFMLYTECSGRLIPVVCREGDLDYRAIVGGEAVTTGEVREGKVGIEWWEGSRGGFVDAEVAERYCRV